jgi:mono/diheme cytochrome c family protein
MFSNKLLIALLLSVLIIGSNCKKKSDEGAGMEGSAPAAAMDADATKGKELYTSNACNSCHGDSGMGDGPAGAALNPKPRNFKDTAGYKQGASEDEVAATLEKGVPGTAMAPYAHIPEADRKLIAKYVVYLQK